MTGSDVLIAVGLTLIAGVGVAAMKKAARRGACAQCRRAVRQIVSPANQMGIPGVIMTTSEFRAGRAGPGYACDRCGRVLCDSCSRGPEPCRCGGSMRMVHLQYPGR